MGQFLIPVQLPSGTKAESIRSYFEHTCILTIDNLIYCWGWNSYGICGVGLKEDTHKWLGDSSSEVGENMQRTNIGKEPESIELGLFFSCAITKDDEIRCWGDNYWGECGTGGTEYYIGDEPSDMGTNLKKVPLPDGYTPEKVSCGRSHACAILSGGKLICWGNNDHGRLGLGHTVDIGRSLSDVGNNFKFTDIGGVAVDICAGDEHSCAIRSTGEVVCWGLNDHGQLGTRAYLSSIGDAGNEMGANLSPVDLGPGRTAKKIMCTRDSSCAILDNDELLCWGLNTYGHLGIGDHYGGYRTREFGDRVKVRCKKCH